MKALEREVNKVDGMVVGVFGWGIARVLRKVENNEVCKVTTSNGSG